VKETDPGFVHGNFNQGVKFLYMRFTWLWSLTF